MAHLDDLFRCIKQLYYFQKEVLLGLRDESNYNYYIPFYSLNFDSLIFLKITGENNIYVARPEITGMTILILF